MNEPEMFTMKGGFRLRHRRTITDERTQSPANELCGVNVSPRVMGKGSTGNR
ncbi:MAG: hypothetical protein KAU52_03545 [Methanosarcinales archaeon]|nr:hypothetical protein [Methanosarcinales archaeon]